MHVVSEYTRSRKYCAIFCLSSFLSFRWAGRADELGKKEGKGKGREGTGGTRERLRGGRIWNLERDGRFSFAAPGVISKCIITLAFACAAVLSCDCLHQQEFSYAPGIKHVD